MAELKIPVDLKSRHDFVNFRKRVRDLLAAKDANWTALAEPIAVSAFLELYVHLAYQAELSHAPGRIVAPESIDLVPDGFHLVTRQQLWDAMGQEPFPIVRRDGDFWVCERFAATNPHLAGNYIPAHRRGNQHSIISRQDRQMKAAAAQQTMLLPPSMFHFHDGKVMAPSEIQRSLWLVKLFDNCLGRRDRRTSEHNEALIAAAGEMIRQYHDEKLKEFGFWLHDHKDHPSVPKTTEEVLTDWNNVLLLITNEAVLV